VMTAGPRHAPGTAGVAVLLGCTPTWFERVFRRETEFSWRAFVRTWRIAEAERLLASRPEFAVRGIATLVGYRSDKAFIRAFRRCRGASPRAHVNGRERSAFATP
jgi:AraC-like DNA-binding protein